jgi:hypothetical protein
LHVFGLRKRSAACALAVGAALALAPAAAAEAGSISLAVSADPAEDRAITVTASGTADTGAWVYALIRHAGGAPCGTTPATDVRGTETHDTTVSSGAYSLARTYTPEDPRRYLLCGWITQGGTVQARVSREIDVRSNAASVAFAAPATAVPDTPVVITVNGATEVRRWLYATVKPAGGAGCGSATSTDTGGSEVVDVMVEGAYSEPRSRSFDPGTYLLCAWVEEGGGDLAPEAVASTTITVAPPDRDGDGVADATDRCPDVAAAGSSIGCPPRVAPAGFTAKAVRRRDRRRPYSFTVTGRLTPPTGMTASAACVGQVHVQFKRGTKTISARRRNVRPNCSWRSSVSFARRSRVGRSGRLKVTVRFLGNDVLAPAQARTFRVRAG